MVVANVQLTNRYNRFKHLEPTAAFALRPSNGQEQVPELFVLSEKVFFSSGDDSRRDFHSLLPGHGQLKQEPILPAGAE